ncbi:hypothetical protein F9B85_00805 [Heliorestis acidaminivorans]|uniref:Uncharacterized protein n=1 Tax=Heliorestis acidaminivorans TaxID=553427 RepID=A0A6I0F9P5_9FIRM|nr:hypothetical protein [Heliorestis acidaminivorans]KAB2954268.1 hypothetical protein F9B85_00805 [Heliorestis acidaminivorans]
MEIYYELMQSILHSFKWVLWTLATFLFHYRQNFYHWSLWVPVIGLIILTVNLQIAEFYEAPVVLTSLFFVLLFVILTHLWGAYLHFIGVGKRVGGQNVNNHMVGPPVVLPLIVATVAILDLLRLLQGDGL